MGSLVDSVVLHYFDLLDPNKTTRIQAGDAANFLRSSGIADTDLAVIWDLADREKAGSLDIIGLAIAIKLVALIQNGHLPINENLNLNVPTAKFSGYPQPTPPASTSVVVDKAAPSRPSRPALPARTASSPHPGLSPSLNRSSPKLAPRTDLIDLASPVKEPRDPLSTNQMSQPQPRDQLPINQTPQNVSRDTKPAGSPRETPRGEKPRTSPPNVTSIRGNKAGSNSPIPIRVIRDGVNKLPPTFINLDKTLPPDNWIVSAQSRAQYESIFHSLNPTNGKLSGGKVKPILLKSQLHVNVLGQIWELSDCDKDGQLDMEEFSLAMFLLNRAREGEQPPSILPQNYMPPSHRIIYTKVQKINWIVPANTRKLASEEFLRADVRNQGMLSGLELRPLLIRKGVPMTILAKIWSLCDIGGTGKLNMEQYALALHLIDLQKLGNMPESLSMELIPPSMRGVNPQTAAAGRSSPQQPPLATTPPSSVGTPHLPPRGSATLPAKQHPIRPLPDKNATLVFARSTPPLNSGTLTPSTGGSSNFSSTSSLPTAGTLSGSALPPSSSIPDELASLNLGSALDNADFSVIKELDTYTKETDSLTKEKKDLQIEIKTAEESLSSAGEELKDLKKQLVQLEKEVEEARKQRDEVQGSLNEADAERRKYEELIAELHKKALNERQQISALQQQIASQDALRKSQEGELQKAREELTKLRQEESHYLHQVESGKRQLDSLIQNLKIVQNDSNLTQAKIVQIEAAHRTIDKALAELAPFGKRCPGSEGKPSILTNIHEVSQLRRAEPDITQMSDITRATAGSSPVSSMSGISVDSYMESHYDTNKNEQTTSNPFGPVSSELFQGDLEPFTEDKQNKRLESESSGANEEHQSGTNTPQLNRRNHQSAESPTLKTDEDKEFRGGAGGFSNPFHGDDDPFKSSGFTEDPFASNPFGEKSDPFSSNPGEDPFRQDNLFAEKNLEDPFISSSKIEATADPFGTPSKIDPFCSSGGEDPFSGMKYNDVDDPFRETNLFPSERDAFNTHDPFANTPDPFAGSTDLFKGSNTSLNSKSTRGSKNSLNNFKNFGSKNSLQDSKTSLNDSATTDSSPKLELKSAVHVQIVDNTPTEEISDTVTEIALDESLKVDNQFDAASETFEAKKPDSFQATENDPFSDSKDGSESFKDSGFESDPFASSNGKKSDLFAEKDPFGEPSDDPFGTDPNDPFGPAATDQFSAQFDENDPFASSAKSGSKIDPFDPFSGPSEDTQVGFTATFS